MIIYVLPLSPRHPVIRFASLRGSSGRCATRPRCTATISRPSLRVTDKGGGQEGGRAAHAPTCDRSLSFPLPSLVRWTLAQPRPKLGQTSASSAAAAAAASCKMDTASEQAASEDGEGGKSECCRQIQFGPYIISQNAKGKEGRRSADGWMGG